MEAKNVTATLAGQCDRGNQDADPFIDGCDLYQKHQNVPDKSQRRVRSLPTTIYTDASY